MVGALALAASVAGVSATASAAPASAGKKAAASVDYNSFVYPFTSTAEDDGNDMPGAQAPNGLAKVNPMTVPGRNHTGYDFTQTHIAGFTNTNIDGVGGSGAGGDVLVVPTSVSYTARPGTGTYSHPFAHTDETATPGYYQVGLGAITGTDNTVTAGTGTIDSEITATTRTGVHRYTFPAGSAPSLVFDLANNYTGRNASSIAPTTLADGRIALSGSFAGGFNGNNYTMYYYAETGEKASVRTWADSPALTADAAQKGVDTGAVITLDPAAGQQADLRITISSISAEQAKIDQGNEVGGKSFDDVRAATAAEWNARLGKVDVSASLTSDPDGDLKKLFYTHLYRMFATPVNATSTTGTYRGVDGAVHQADDFTYYDGWSSWDDFRKYSVIAYVDPTLYRNIIQSLIDLFADQAAAGAGSLSSLMQGVPTVRFERSSVIIADALSKGYTGFSRLDEAYPTLHNLVGYYSGQELRQGYINDRPGASLERGYDQWALAIIAEQLGKTAEAKDLRAQAALPFANVFKPGAYTAADGTKVGLLSPRNAAGDFPDVDYTQFEAANLYQGTLWQYNWYGAYDMADTAKAMGGTDATRLALENMFGEGFPDDGSKMLHSNANEIDLQAPYLFNYVGEPSLTQKWAKAIYTQETWNRYIATGSTGEHSSGGGQFTPPIKQKVYQLDPHGFLPTMDNDAGTMSTMFVAAAIGLFPVTAGSSQYQIGSPFFESTTIHYDSGRDFTVSADNVSDKNFYIQSANLGGSAYKNTWVDYSDIVGGHDLAVTMASTPSKWGTDGTPSYSLSTSEGGVGGGSPSKTYPVVASKTSVLAGAQGDVDSSVTLTLGGGAAFSGSVGSSIIRSHQATISGLPDSVVADVVVTNPTTATVTLKGSITKNTRFFVNFADAALANGVTADQLTGQGISNESALDLSVSSVDRLALQKLVDQAVLVQPGSYSFVTFTALSTALSNAQKALADADATSARLRSAKESLQKAIDGLALNEGAFRVLQAEKSDEWSGGQLKNEAYQSAGDLGGVTTGSWIRYRQLDFTDKTPKTLAIHYANQVAPTAAPSGVTLHAGDENGPVVGSAVLPGTGSWGTYLTVNADITDPATLKAAKAVTLVFTAPDGQDWVSNFDWFQFLTGDEVAPAPAGIVLEAEKAVANSGGSLKPEGSSWSDGTTVTDVGGTYDKAWFDFGTVDFGTSAAGTMAVHYVNNSARCGTDSRVDLFVDSFDAANPGTPYATVPLAVTGSDWSHAGTATISLPKTIKGSHKVYVMIHSTTDSGHPYVANLDNFTFTPKVNTTIEAESFVANSGGVLKTEQSTWSDGPVTNLGGTHDNDWLDYGDIELGTTPLNGFSVHYVNNSARCGTGSKLDLYLDSFDPANPGTPYASVPLAVTGADWAKAGTASILLPGVVTGTHHVYVMLHTTTTSNQYVANIDKMNFTKVVDKTELTKAIADVSPLADQGAKFGAIDFAVFTRELASARALAASTKATQQAVDSQVLSLRLAAGQLTSNVRLQLEHLLTVANAITNARYTDESWAAFRSAVEGAAAVAANAAATDEAMQSSFDALTAALNALAAKPVVVPVAPVAPTASVSGSSVSVHWTAPTDDGGSPITGYRVTLSDGHSITIGDPTQLSVVFSWLAEGTTYTVQVTALNALGASTPTDATAPVTTTAPPAMDAVAPTQKAAGLAPSYDSDHWPTTPTGVDYNVYLLRGFSDLPVSVLAPNQKLAVGSTPTAFNDTKALEINRAASSAEVDRAQRDADNSPESTMVDGFGSRLGPLFTAAMAAGELPQTRAVLDHMGNGLGGADAAKPFYQYLRPYVRMGLASGGGLVRDNKTGGYDGLAGSGSYPSGHTFGGYTFGTTMATLLPELAPQLLARASEYGDNRIILGFHYPLDVIGGRMDSQATVSHRWADPAFAAELEAAHTEIESTLLARCQTAGFDSLATCSGDAYRGLDDAAATSLYTDRLTYGFPKVAAGGKDLIVPKEAVALLDTAFPELTDAQRTQVLQQTALDSGQPLDLTSVGDESWERINLAKAMTAKVTVNADGSVTVGNYADATQQNIATASAITVGDRAIDGFDPETRTYLVDWPANKPLPDVAAIPSVDGATAVVATQALRLANPKLAADAIAGRSQTITVTSADGQASRTYTVAFWLTGAAVDPGTPVGDPGTGAGTIPGKPGTAASGPLAYTGAPDITGAVIAAMLAVLIGAALVVRRKRASIRRPAGRHSL